ncbi:MAG TPA: hypothetical protein VGC22_08735 [Chitinophaga sp.]
MQPIPTPTSPCTRRKQQAGSAYWHTTYNSALGGTYTTQRFKRSSAAAVYFQELGGFYDDNTN